MNKSNFIGRENEIRRLNDLHNRNLPGLVVIKGRRRIGKSRLVKEFASSKKGRFWSFSGLAPQGGMGAQSQRDNFTKQFASFLDSPKFSFDDWSDIFDYLSHHIKSGDIILLDEISWMGSNDNSFIPKLKDWWDRQSKNVTLVFCGSVSTWIEENILRSTAFFGRVNLTIALAPLNIAESAKLLQQRGFQGSNYDKYKLLSIVGGIPWYLEQVKPGYSADEIIKELCFEKNGLLTLEFNNIFHDLFGSKGTIYKRVLQSLNSGNKTLAEIRDDIEFSHSGKLSKIMEDLIIAGFVERQDLWSLKSNKQLKQSLYRIYDPYIRFYLKVIEPYLPKINSNISQDIIISQISGFDVHIGLQIEYLLLQNRPLLLKAIGVNVNDILADGPYRQSKTTTQKGCQIDYLIQTMTHNLFVCEFKFKRGEIHREIISEMKSKISAFSTPRNTASIAVLFHFGGVTPSVEIEGYFYRIIDINNFLE